MSVTYDRGGTTRTARITAGKASEDRRTCIPAKGSTSGTTCLGVTSQEFTTYQFPVDIKINTQLVGGPSAGLAFTLAIIDDLTPGDLTGGKTVAVTGTIDADGQRRRGRRRRAEGDHRAHQRRAVDDRAQR